MSLEWSDICARIPGAAFRQTAVEAASMSARPVKCFTQAAVVRSWRRRTARLSARTPAAPDRSTTPASEDGPIRNAALILGLVGGLWALAIGFFVYGYIAFIDWFGEVPDLVLQVEDPALYRVVAVAAPLLAIAGAGMARSRALWGGILLLLAAGGLYLAYGLGVFTVFPLAFCGVAGLLAVAAARPDEETAHFRGLR
jgi:hypothetical protein